MADGKYVVTVRLYASADAKQALWEEVHPIVPVTGGLFALTMGGSPVAKAPLPVAALAAKEAPWVGVQVSDDGELSRVQLRAVPYALRAASAAVASDPDPWELGDELVEEEDFSQAEAW